MDIQQGIPLAKEVSDKLKDQCKCEVDQIVRPHLCYCDGNHICVCGKTDRPCRANIHKCICNSGTFLPCLAIIHECGCHYTGPIGVCGHGDSYDDINYFNKIKIKKQICLLDGHRCICTESTETECKYMKHQCICLIILNRTMNGIKPLYNMFCRSDMHICNCGIFQAFQSPRPFITSCKIHNR